MERASHRQQLPSSTSTHWVGFGSLFVVAALAAVACREPAADDPGYRASVLCVQKMKARSEAGQGTRNDSKASCIGWVGDRIRANPNGDYSAFADCVLGAPDEAAAGKCK